MSYTSQAKIEAYLGKSLTPAQSGQIAIYISAASDFIERFTNRKFEQQVAAVRYFDGNGKREIDVDDFLSITSLRILEVDGTLLIALNEGADQDYITFPYNLSNKFRITLVPSSSIGAFLTGKKNIEITGTWNYSSAVPAAIELVATMLVSGMIKLSDNAGQDIQSESLGDYSVTFKNLDEVSLKLGVKQILDQYKIWEL